MRVDDTTLTFIESMKTLSTILLLTLSIPTNVMAEQIEYQPGYSSEENCYRYEYREEYIPGTSNNPGYVKSFREKVKISCKNGRAHTRHEYYREEKKSECVGGVVGGIAGGTAAFFGTKGANDRWWSTPLGILGGAVVGDALLCD